MADPLLSDLCRICHINPHKYRCPRCLTLTCSLPCIKRHKKWAQCSGIRDPAAYLKRSELATPSAIDKDYNFLTSIERKIDNAERDTDDRGVVLRDGDTRNWREKGLNGPMKGETQMQTAIERCKVVIDKAPKGMARAKQNKTKWYKKQRCLCWTVEWIHDDGRRDLGECLEFQLILEAYAAQFDTAEPPKKRRKSSNNTNDLVNTIATSTPSMEFAAPVAISIPSVPSANNPTSDSRPAEPPGPSASSELPAPTTATPASNQQSPDPLPPVAPSVPSPTALTFYLHLPSTPTSARVLIPLSPSSTLATCLSHRLVLEFPTIYALRSTPDELPEGFITEKEFLKGLRRGGVRSDINHLIEEVEVGEVAEGSLAGGFQERMDEKRLADVLRRDLGGGLQ